ncbi:MAG: hypothetical protein ACYTEQ_28510 [Planctomycetota bacterium]|jgi:hypothetical protein
MAFGGVIQSDSNYNASVENHRLTFSAITEGSLLVVCGFTGATVQTAMSGWSTAVALADGANNDDSGIYWKIAGASESTSVGADNGAADESNIICLEIEGPWESSPVDVTQTDGPNATEEDPQTTGTTAATAQNDEVAIGFVAARHTGFTICPVVWSNSFNTFTGSCLGNTNKMCAAAIKVLTTTGAQETSGNFADTPVGGNTMGMIATFKKEAAEAAFGPTVLIKPASAAP